MLQGGLIRSGRRLAPALAAALIALTACSGDAVRDAVVEPGLEAVDEATALACETNAATLRTAIEAYGLLEGAPPDDEQALIDAEFLREATTEWDVVDGVIVPEDPACGDQAPIATVDIVTATETLDADELYASFDQVQIDSVGGEACARELAEIIAAGETFLAQKATEPADLEELVATGYLASMPDLWRLADLELVPVDGSGCTDLG